MFSFFKKNKKDAKDAYQQLKVDMHSHLIPRIDDGSKSIEESISLLRQLIDLGYKKVITTPHIYYELYPNSSEIILKGLSQLKAVIKKEELDIELEAAAEYFMDDHFEGLLEKDDILTIGSTKMVLVEMSFFAAPPKLYDYLFRLQTKGYQPLLAHPERYSFYNNDIQKFEELKDRGCLFQINLLSLQGHYGKSVQKMAEKLLKVNMVEFFGTDLHNEFHAEALEELGKSKYLENLLSKHNFRNPDLY